MWVYAEIPRILTSALPFGRIVALLRDRYPSRRPRALGAFREPGETRKQDEVRDGQDDPATQAGRRGRKPQVRFPQTAEPRAPQPPPVVFRRDPGELRKRVVHVKRLVVQDLVKNLARRRIVLQYLAIDGETAGGGLFRQVQKGKQHFIAPVNFQGVDAVAAGHKPRRLKKRVGSIGKRPQAFRSALTEEVALTQIVVRVNHRKTVPQ